MRVSNARRSTNSWVLGRQTLRESTRLSRTSILVGVENVVAVGFDQAWVEGVAFSLGGGPEVEDEGDKVGVEEESDEPFEGGGDGLDDVAASDGLLVVRSGGTCGAEEEIVSTSRNLLRIQVTHYVPPNAMAPEMAKVTMTSLIMALRRRCLRWRLQEGTRSASSATLQKENGTHWFRSSHMVSRVWNSAERAMHTCEVGRRVRD